MNESAERRRGDSDSLTERTAWLMAAKTLAMAFNVAIPLLLVREMTQSEFGLYKQAFLVVGTAFSILPLGFAMSAFYFFPREPDRKGGVVLNTLLFHVAVGGAAAAVLLVYPDLVSLLFQEPTLARYAGWMGLVILLLCASTFLEFIAIANQETRLAAILIGLLQMAKALSLVVAAVIWGTLAALLAAAALQASIQLAVLLVYLGSRFPGYWKSFDRSLLVAQLAYALPYGAAALLWWVRLDLHHYFVGHRFDAATYAIYAVGCFQLPLLGILKESVGSVMIPRVSELQQEGSPREIVHLTARSVRKLAAFYLPVAACAILVAREVIVLLFTERYVQSVPIFRVNAALIPLAMIAIASDAVIRAYAEHRYYVLKLRVVLTVLLVAGLWFAVQEFGLLGAIGVVAAFELVERAFLAGKTASILGMKSGDARLFSDVGKVTLATLAAVLVAAPVRASLTGAPVAVVLAVTGIAFSGAYVLAVLVLKIPTAGEMSFFERQWRRLRRRAAEGFGRSGAAVLGTRIE